MASDLLMLDVTEDIEETLLRLQRECQQDVAEVTSQVKPSYSYGCARTSGVTVYRKRKASREPRAPKNASPQSKEPSHEPYGKLANSRAIRYLKRTEQGQTATVKIKKAAPPRRLAPKTVKANQKNTFRSRLKSKTTVGKPRQTKQNCVIGRFSCEDCGDVFTYKNNLKRHQELHKVASNEYRCDECGKTFSAKRNLKRHLKCHEPVDPEDRSYACDKCDKSFHRAKYLYHHQKVHDVARPYACQMCPKTFKTRYNLQSHEAIHLNCKQYVCQFCGMAFTRSSYRTIHERIHTKEKPFKCDQCNKAFMRGDHLKNHKKCHNK